MSINVTVHGNPISIKKGKMVTCDTDSEFDRRRRIRLQQVRQQSKEIAADVRNRVRKEKEKQLSKVEQKGEQDLKRWQARKLLALQQQYQDCLKEVGSAHTKAALEPDADEVLNELATKNRAEANLRSKIATEKKKNEDTQKRLELEKPIEIKKNTRKIEDARSAMVTQLNQELSSTKKKKKRKKISTDVTIMNNLVSESDTSEIFISDGENISGNIIDEKGKKKQKIYLDIKSPEVFAKRKENRKSCHSTTTESSFGLSSPPSDLNDTVVTLSPNKNYNRSVLSANTTPPLSPQKGKHIKKDDFKKITKISDRIKQRKLSEVVNKECGCECDTSDNHLNFVHNIEKPKKISRGTYKPNLQIESYKICDIQSETEQNNQTKKCLPYVPTTTLQPDSLTNTSECQPNTCKYYDHLNRFSKEYNAQPIVQKISKQSIQVQPPTDRSESSELIKTMQARDKIAHTRGVQALEKVKIHKDYRQLMDELPLLQRQERLASMRTHNPMFHMPEERLQELERRRQSRIENIFEKYYHKSKTLETPLVTIRPVQKTPPVEDMKLPFRALDITESPVQLNVAEWKTEDKLVDSETGTQGQEDDLENRQKALVDLLQRVNKQRELLLQEVSTLPSSSNLQKILQDEEILKLICPCPNKSEEYLKKTQKEKGKTVVSTGTSPLSVKSPSKTNLYTEKENNKRGLTTNISSDSSSEVIKKKKHKKVKCKKTKKIIKNEGTQTSPLINNSKSTSTKISTDSPEPEKPSCSCKITTNTTNKCQCDKLFKEDSKKLCEIIIKMNDQADVKVCKNDEQPASKKVILNVSKPTKITVRTPTNGNDVSSSTTYMSLPDGPAQQNITKPATNSKQRQQYKDLLHHKPQQTNVDGTDSSKKIISAVTDPGRKEITPTLLRYIQKLLSMSRQSIDELTVSSISDVSTPGTSIVDTKENSNPFVQLQNVMQYYNLSFNDIQKHLASSDTSKSSVEYSSREITAESVQQKTVYIRTSSTDSIEARKEQEQKPQSKNVEDKPPLRNVEERKLPPQISSSKPAVDPEKSSSSSTESIKSQDHVAVAELVKKTFGLQPEDMQEIPYANILSKYTDLTKTCCDRITKLTEMIDNVRLEKERLLSPDGSDKYETSITSYLELPKMTNDSTRVESNGNKSSRHSNASSTNTSMSQDAVDKYFLTVDKDSSQQCSPTCSGKENSEDVDELPVSNKNFNNNANPEMFVPMLQGIPKYTEPTDNQAMNFLNSPVKQFLLNAKTKPPPSLLRNANKYNLNIDMTPHELSTIAELDTIVSSRNVSAVLIPRSRSPEEKIPSRDETVREISQKHKDESEFATLTPEHKSKTSPKEQKSGSSESKSSRRSSDSDRVLRKSSLKKSARSSSSSQEGPLSNTELSGVQPLNSDRSTSSPEDMETILRNMGLGWAVSTLKKTHEALALSSSSSSVEASFRKRVSFKNSSNSNSNSDVSLKDLLSKGLMKKISSSTLLTDSSGISPHLQDFDISEIRDPTVPNRDGSQHRTSTPVHHSKSTDSKKELFTGDSDISSVRLHSEEFFLSIPNVSLDTNKSLSKSKE